MDLQSLRSEIDAAIAAGKTSFASSCLSELWSKDPVSSTAGYVISRYESLRQHLALKPYRVAILRSFTVEPLVPLLRAGAFTYGIDLNVHVGDFNAYVQEMLDEQSGLYAFAPDGVILAVQTCDIAPDLWQDFSGMTAEAVTKAVSRVAQSFRDCVRALRRHTNASLVIHGLEQPAIPRRGIVDAQSECSQGLAIHCINGEIRRLAAQEKSAYVLDYDGLMARYGRQTWRDLRKWLTARLPIAAPHLTHMAQEWLRFLVPLAGKTAKVVAVDLDNTLWGGVIGEDGMTGIQLGPEYPGAAYQEFQRALLDLSNRGILLAVCSKNNPEDASEAIERHPGMLLRSKRFAALRVNWNDKSQSLREIASELNIGIDAVAFVDDNPVERKHVRAALPDVAVLELPEDSTAFAAALRDSPLFERLTLSEEDRKRSSYYAAERERKELEQTFSTKEEFYKSLAQEVEISAVAAATLARVAQLTQKTNQFNLTTRRYTEQQISELAGRPSCGVWSIRVRDCFGDNGLVGVAITFDRDETCEIDSFLMSCRVIGRTVETAFLARLVKKARERRRRTMQGWFFPTKKNAPAREFYANHGFRIARRDEDRLLWELDLTRAEITWPPWIKLAGATEE
ncbi:MAG TPA: HAD-IIIC family phosphatase [Terriglobia bacterium]|nr:HAD-IIIC family phosphatase [Terriglobia bacterium]